MSIVKMELNDMMLEWNVDGIFVNYTEVSEVSDTNTAFRWAWGAMKSFLGIRLCSEYQMPIPPGLVALGEEQLRIIRSHVYQDSP